MKQVSTFVEVLQQRVSDYGQKMAFTFLQDGETILDSLTYLELEERVKAIAGYLQSRGATGERALLLFQPGLSFITAFFGCLYAGVIAVPAYPPRANRSLNRLEAIFSDCSAKFALTTEGVIDNISSRFKEDEKTNSIEFIASDTIPLEWAKQWIYPNINHESLAFLQYTSGSTGTPKGVMISHKNILANNILIKNYFGDSDQTIGVSWLPPYHDMGLIGGVIQPMYLGCSMYMMSPVTFLQRPLNWLQAISKFGGTTSGAPNFAYDLCIQQINDEQRQTLNLKTWTLAFTGAEPVRYETLEKFSYLFAHCGFDRNAFYPCYGMAETTLIVSGGIKGVYPVLKSIDDQQLKDNKIAIVDPNASNSSIFVSSGQEILEQKIRIVNPETFQLCPENEVGEIWVNSPSVAQGYWNRKEQTLATFNAYIAEEKESKTPYLRTGDLGFMQKGQLFVTGRLKDLIIIRGRNHYPQDIELTVDKSHTALRPGCGSAFAVDINGEERLVIVQEVHRSAIRKLNAEEVTKKIRQSIVETHELLPYAILLLKTGSIPKTSSGKIQRHACKSEFLANTLDVVGEWRETKVEISSQPIVETIAKPETQNNPQMGIIQQWLITKISEKVSLSSQEIEVDEPFASYGLDSVQAVRLSAELEDWLGYKLEPTLAYDYPSIALLSQYLANLTNNSPNTVLSVKNLPQNSTITQAQEDIAIIGMGCRFPKADTLQDYWELLSQGKDGISQVKGRWENEDVISWGGYLENIDQFDPQFFGISPREAQRMDPQQRLLLEVAYETLENAGIPLEKLAGTNTGVFIGVSSSDYSQLQLGDSQDAYVGTGNAHSITANRLSYILDLHGPSLSVDTACSSSLVAVHLAIQSLRQGESDCALVGGVNLILSSELIQTFTAAGMLSEDGRCKTFDASANGYVRGEGCGVVLLKPLSKAITEGNSILGVIKGSAINQDGRSNGLTAPNGIAQQQVIVKALASAKVSPDEISYVEAHGTGTVLGDPIEMKSVKSILGSSRSNSNPLYVGSVKTNIGHLEASAGIAGLIKVVLALNYGQIPPNLHFKSLNPHIDLQDTNIYIPTTLTEWKSAGKSRLAGVSSFGFGGTNAHVILSEFVR